LRCGSAEGSATGEAASGAGTPGFSKVTTFAGNISDPQNLQQHGSRDQPNLISLLHGGAFAS